MHVPHSQAKCRSTKAAQKDGAAENVRLGYGLRVNQSMLPRRPSSQMLAQPPPPPPPSLKITHPRQHNTSTPGQSGHVDCTHVPATRRVRCPQNIRSRPSIRCAELISKLSPRCDPQDTAADADAAVCFNLSQLSVAPVLPIYCILTTALSGSPMVHACNAVCCRMLHTNSDNLLQLGMMKTMTVNQS
jgi:hypothetical protein